MLTIVIRDYLLIKMQSFLFQLELFIDTFIATLIERYFINN